MTWLEMAKETGAALGVPLDDGIADHLLWEVTAFPFADEEHVRQQLRRYIVACKAGDVPDDDD